MTTQARFVQDFCSRQLDLVRHAVAGVVAAAKEQVGAKERTYSAGILSDGFTIILEPTWPLRSRNLPYCAKHCARWTTSLWMS